jgi:hypothetical protein
MSPAAKIAKSSISRQEQLRARILRNTQLIPETGCRVWIKRHNNQGYPIITVRLAGRKNPVPLLAHRVALAVYKGAPRAGEEAAHDPTLCPHKDCCEPTHLRWATRLENEADKRHPSRLRLREVHPPIAQEAELVE